MFSRTLRKSVLDTRVSTSALPPTFLLPLRARYFNSTAQIIDSPSESLHIPRDDPSASKIVAVSPSSLTSSTPALIKTRRSPPAAPSPSDLPPSKPVSDNTRALLPMLLAQPHHYISAHIHGRPYLVTPGDTIRLPFKMPGVVPGDVLRLNRASAIGSRDYTLKGTPYVDERIFELRATVVGSECEPVRVKTKTKRRNRRINTIRSKHRFTILRVGELKVKTLEEIDA